MKWEIKFTVNPRSRRRQAWIREAGSTEDWMFVHVLTAKEFLRNKKAVEVKS